MVDVLDFVVVEVVVAVEVLEVAAVVRVVALVVVAAVVARVAVADDAAVVVGRVPPGNRGGDAGRLLFFPWHRATIDPSFIKYCSPRESG